MRHVLVFEDGEELGPGVVKMQEEGQQVALCEAGGRPGHRRRLRRRRRGLGLDAATTRPGALKLLGLDPELGRVHAEAPAGLAREHGRFLGIGHLRQQERDAGMGGGAAARGAEVVLGERLVEDEGQQRARGVEPRTERLGAFGPQEAVRIVAGREHGDPDGEHAGLLEPARPRHRPAQVLDVRAVGHHLLDPARGLLAGGIGVEERDDLVGVTPQEAELRRGEGRAEGGHRLGEAMLMRHQAVEVALDEDGPAALAHGRAGDVEGVQDLSLDVERRLRGVEVLGLFSGEGAAAEGHDPPLRIADREEQPAAEAIVEAAARLARKHETGLDEQVVADAFRLHPAEQRVPRARAHSRARSAGRPRDRRRACRGTRAPWRRPPPRAIGCRTRRPAPSRAAAPRACPPPRARPRARRRGPRPCARRARARPRGRRGDRGA